MPVKKLTSRQKEIVDRITRGWSNKMIAVDLKIEICTVKVHLQNIYPKLGVHSRYEVISRYKDSEYGNF